MENGKLSYERVQWLDNTNIYEVNVRQYTPEGTFDAFRNHIPRLQKMGVKVLWFMPIHPIGLKNRKESLGSYYSIKDYKGINPEFGDINDFKKLVNEAHQNGMKVIIDWVANHTAWDNEWVTRNPEYYAKDSTGKMYSPYDWADVVQLDHKNTAQQDAMVDAMEYWVKETNIDGFRCDMAHMSPLELWRKARLKCDAHKQLLWLAETQDTPYFEVFDIIYAWEWLHKMEDYCKGKTNIEGLDSIINKYNVDFNNNKFRILFTSNHDENSWQGTEYDRLGKGAKAFATLCATLPGVPLVYSGQEVPLLKKLNFFNKDKIGFEVQGLHNFYKDLLTLKFNNPSLQANANATFARINTSNNEKIYCFLRKNEENELLVIANLSAEKRDVTLYDDKVQGSFQNPWDTKSPTFDGKKTITMDPWQVYVLVK